MKILNRYSTFLYTHIAISICCDNQTQPGYQKWHFNYTYVCIEISKENWVDALKL